MINYDGDDDNDDINDDDDDDGDGDGNDRFSNKKKTIGRIIMAEASLDILDVFGSFSSTCSGYGKSSHSCTKADLQPFIKY